jgi:hypothetical protein
MRGRTILILLAVLVVLAGLATVIEQGRNRKTHLKGAQLIPGYKTELVDRIRFRSEGKNVSLEKKGNEWVVASEGGFPAEKKPVEDILEALRKATADEVISTNPANQGVFMADSSGAEVWIDQQGKEIAHLYIGKPGPDMLSTYVRSAKSDRVILAPGYLPSLFQERDTWRMRTMISVKPEEVTRYEYVSPSRGEVVLSKSEAGTWRMEKPDTGRVESDRLTFPLRVVAALKAEGFADGVDPTTAGLGADTTHVRITTAGGATYTVQIGSPAASGRNYVRLEGGDQIYTMARGRISSLMVPATGLKPPAGS